MGVVKVLIEFFGKQRDITRTESISMPITEKTTVNDVLEYVRRQYPTLPLDEETIFIAVNKKKAPLKRILRTDDIISFLPFISGG